MRRKIKVRNVLWSKTDIAVQLSIETAQLELYLSEKCKKSVGWEKGKQFFRDLQVLEMLKDLFPAKNDIELRAIIGYEPQLEIKFNSQHL